MSMLTHPATLVAAVSGIVGVANYVSTDSSSAQNYGFAPEAQNFTTRHVEEKTGTYRSPLEAQTVAPKRATQSR